MPAPRGGRFFLGRRSQRTYPCSKKMPSHELQECKNRARTEKKGTVAAFSCGIASLAGLGGFVSEPRPSGTSHVSKNQKNACVVLYSCTVTVATVSPRRAASCRELRAASTHAFWRPLPAISEFERRHATHV